jgi:hypothetical protein
MPFSDFGSLGIDHPRDDRRRRSGRGGKSGGRLGLSGPKSARHRPTRRARILPTWEAVQAALKRQDEEINL